MAERDSSHYLKNGYTPLFHAFIERHKWPILGIILFLLLSYLLIFSNYNHLHADAGIFGRSAKIFFEEGRIDASGAAPALLGQLLFTYPFFLITGFNLKMIHITVYVVNFLLLFAMYLLLLEFKVNPFLSFWGALTLLISPISLVFIDWYLTEPFFMCYLVFSLLFFIKGLKKDKIVYLYLGSLFCILGILTRQYAISIPGALVLIVIIYHKKINKRMFLNSIAASLLPVITIGVFYLLLSFAKKTQAETPYAYSSARSALNSILTNPLDFLSMLYYGSLYYLHYIPLYLAPLFMALYVSFIASPEKIKKLYSRSGILIFSIAYVLAGTFLLYSKKGQLMPYIPSIFPIGALQKIFDISLLGRDRTALILTIFSGFGAIILLISILGAFFTNISKKEPSIEKGKKLNKKKKREIRKIEDKKEEKRIDLAEKFFYLWGIVYGLTTIILFLKYDRYIYPVSILMVYVILRHFSYNEKWKKTFIIIYVLFFTVFIYPQISRNLNLGLEWEASQSLMDEGISPNDINGGLGFNNFYSLVYIDKLYKNFRVKRPVNWQKLHPLANFFVSGEPGLEKKRKDIILYRTYHKERLFGLLKREKYIYKRKEGFQQPIFL
ncbi:MAG: hypothetical protein ACMUIU_09000 [bacterium]